MSQARAAERQQSTSGRATALKRLAALPFSVVVLVLLFHSLSLAQQSEAVRLVRLPPPSTVVTTGNLKKLDKERILFAAGAVAFRPPVGWWVKEIVRDWEVYLIVSPSVPTFPQGFPDDGIWIRCSVVRRPLEDWQGELSEKLQDRMRFALDGNVETTLVQRIAVDGWPALVQRFELTKVGDGSGERRTLRGRHVLVRTDWGCVELRGLWPSEVWDEREEQMDLLLADAVLGSPKPLVSPTSTVAETRSAEPILGSWRSASGSMRLHGDGRVQIWPDRPGAELTAFGVASSRPASAALDGQFVAVGDLLFIAWRDGTRLNLRWYRNEDDLVLADHEGRVSRLKRLLE